MCVCVYVSMCECACVPARFGVCMCSSVCVCVSVCMCMCVCICVCVCMCMCVRACACVRKVKGMLCYNFLQTHIYLKSVYVVGTKVTNYGVTPPPLPRLNTVQTRTQNPELFIILTYYLLSTTKPSQVPPPRPSPPLPSPPSGPGRAGPFVAHTERKPAGGEPCGGHTPVCPTD